MPSTAISKENNDGTNTLRSVISLVLFIHLFCVAVVLSSNFRRSRLQARLVSLFAPYTQLLHLDPDFTPYYFTLGRASDDDTWLAIDLYADANQPVNAQPLVKSVKLHDSTSVWLGNRRRCLQLAQMLAASADPENENDDITSEIAKPVGTWLIRQTNNGRAVVRCVRRMSQPYDLSTLNTGFPADRPTDTAYDQALYEADVWIDEDGIPQVQKRVSRAEAAPRQTTTPPATGPGNRAQ
jgi:hypothetical protein